VRRHGFLVSEWLIALIILGGLLGLTPMLLQNWEQIAWKQVEKQLRLMQYRAFAREHEFNWGSILFVEQNKFCLNKGPVSYFPSGWVAVDNYRIRLSERSTKAGTIYLRKDKKLKKIVFQVGGGTFDIQD